MDQLDIQVVRGDEAPKRAESWRPNPFVIGLMAAVLAIGAVVWLGSQTPAQELPPSPSTSSTTLPSPSTTEVAAPDSPLEPGEPTREFSVLRWLQLGQTQPPVSLASLDSPLWLVLGPGVKGRYLVSLSPGGLDFVRLRCQGVDAQQVARLGDQFLFNAGANRCSVPADLSQEPTVVESMPVDSGVVATSGSTAWICAGGDDETVTVVGWDLNGSGVTRVQLPDCPVAASGGAFLLSGTGANTYWLRDGETTDVEGEQAQCSFAGVAGSWQICRTSTGIEFRTDLGHVIQSFDVALPPEASVRGEVSPSGSYLVVRYVAHSSDVALPASPVLLDLRSGEQQDLASEFNFAPGVALSRAQVAALQFSVPFCPSCGAGSLVLSDLEDGTTARLFKFPEELNLSNVEVYGG